VAELEELTADALVAPRRIPGGQSRDQVADVGGQRRPARSPAAPERCPLPSNELAVPAQERRRSDGQHAARGPRQAPPQQRQDEPVARAPGGARDLPPKHADLVAQRQQLDVARPTASSADGDDVGG
jgi:hypothetical protein